MSAFFASSVKGELPERDVEAVFQRDALIEGRVHISVDIEHLAAAEADEVRMLLCVCVKPLLPVNDADGYDEPLILEYGKIPVDSAEADVRDIFSHFLVNPVRRGVGRRPADFSNTASRLRLNFFMPPI